MTDTNLTVLRAGGNAMKRVVAPLWIVVILIAVWFIASAGSTNVFFPPLSKIITTLVSDLADGTLLADLGFSLGNLTAGLLIAAVAGIGLGLWIGESKMLQSTLSPLIDFFRSVPQTALIPLIIGAFGIGVGPKIGMIAFACIWPILLNTIDGVLSVDVSIRRVARAYRIPKRLYFRRVVVQGALPQIVAGIGVALPIGVIVMVVSELFASKQGLGYYIVSSAATFKMAEVWAGAIMVGIVGYGLSLLFSAFEHRVLRWYLKSGS